MTLPCDKAAAPAAVLFGLEGPSLTEWEKGFFREVQPAGFIIFRRNVESPAQLAKLTMCLRDVLGRGDAPILIDQEGGRVQRLRPPHWPALPAMGVYGELARKDLGRAKRGAWLQARLIADDLHRVGIDVDCLPCLDLQLPTTHQVIGDRSFGADPEVVAELGQSVCDGLLAGGVSPVIKHLPGHGRAGQDSHKTLPQVDADITSLQADFMPFRRLAAQRWGMTAHILFTALDREKPATLSRKVIQEIIRGEIGFDGLLVSDDINMEALSGPLGQRAAASLAAGCDLVLHCSGKKLEMEEVAAAVPSMSSQALERLARARPPAPQAFDRDAALEELEALAGAVS